MVMTLSAHEGGWQLFHALGLLFQRLRRFEAVQLLCILLSAENDTYICLTLIFTMYKSFYQ